MQPFWKLTILFCLSGAALETRLAYGAQSARPNSIKQPAIVMTHYEMSPWHFQRQTDQVYFNVRHKTLTHDLGKGGNTFYETCDHAPDFEEYGWYKAAWGPQATGTEQYGISSGTNVCGVQQNPTTVSISAPTFEKESCEGSTVRMYKGDFGESVIEDVKRVVKTKFELRTGDAGSTRQNLFVLNCPATKYYNLFWPEIDNYSDSATIPPARIQIGSLGALDTDGYLCVALGDNGTRDVTPKIPSVKYYRHNVAVGKYLLKSTVACAALTDTNLDRTNLGVGEHVAVFYDVLNAPPVNISWTKTAGSLSTTNGYSTTLIAPSNAINTTVTAHAKTANVPIEFTVLAPDGYHHADITSTPSYAVGVSAAKMHLNVYLAPTHVSFNAVRILEVGGPASSISGYFLNHTPESHGSAQGANKWYAVGCDNLVLDDFDNAGYGPPSTPSPWDDGSFTWHIPVIWRVGTGQTNYLTSWDQVFTIEPNGTFTVSKFERSVTRTINDVITTQ
jgi:hypothetical protein